MNDVIVTGFVGDVLQQHVSPEGGRVYRSPRTLRPQLGLGAVTRQPAAKPRVQQAGQRSGPSQYLAAKVSTPGQQDLAGEIVTFWQIDSKVN